MRRVLATLCFVCLSVFNISAQAQDDDALAEMARKAQDPLADLKGLMTDNTIAFDGGPNKDTSYAFQLQPVYSLPTTGDWNMILRGIVPIAGLEPGVVAPPIGPEPRPPVDSTWGISDSIMQMFFSPKTDGSVKWGIGPQVSVKTRTSDRVAGAGWGYGVAGVLFGGVGNLSMGLVAMYHWGEDDFEVGTLQPIIMYAFPNKPGYYMGYNNALTYNRKATSGNKWQVPLGLTFGRTLLLGSGNGLDLSVGVYDIVAPVDNGSDWQLKFGISYLLN